MEETEYKVLLALQRNQDVLPVMDLIESAKISSGNSVQRAVALLINRGLIYDEKEEAFPRRRLIKLTVLGRKVADKLLEAERYIEEAERHSKSVST